MASNPPGAKADFEKKTLGTRYAHPERIQIKKMSGLVAEHLFEKIRIIRVHPGSFRGHPRFSWQSGFPLFRSLGFRPSLLLRSQKLIHSRL